MVVRVNPLSFMSARRLTVIPLVLVPSTPPSAMGVSA